MNTRRTTEADITYGIQVQDILPSLVAPTFHRQLNAKIEVKHSLLEELLTNPRQTSTKRQESVNPRIVAKKRRSRLGKTFYVGRKRKQNRRTRARKKLVLIESWKDAPNI